MIELDILIEELELSNMSRVSKKYIYENLLDVRQKLTEQLRISDVGISLKILCKDLNLDPESVLLEYCNTKNGFEVYCDEGIEEIYLVKKGFIQL